MTCRDLRSTTPLVAASAAAALFLTSCAEGGTSHGDPEDATSVTIAGSDYLGAAQLQLAQAAESWESGDLDVDLQRFPSGRDVLDAVLGGTAEVGSVGDLPTVSAILAEEDIRILGALSYGTDWRVLTTQSAEIEGPADLEGQRVGVPQGTNAQYLLGQVLQSAGLSEEDVEVVNLDANQVPSSLVSGDIDAGITFPTFWSSAEEALGDEADWFTFDDYQSATLLIAREETDEQTLARVVEVLVESQEQLEDPEAAQEAIAEGSGGEITTEQVQELWDNYEIGLTLDDDLLMTLSAEAEWATAELDIPGDPSYDHFLSFAEPEPLEAADPNAVNLTEGN